MESWMDENSQPRRQSNWNRSKFDNRQLRPILYKHGFKVRDVKSVCCEDIDDRITITLGDSFGGSVVSVLGPDREEQIVYE